MEQRAPGRQRALRKAAVADAAIAAVIDASLAAERSQESLQYAGTPSVGSGPRIFLRLSRPRAALGFVEVGTASIHGGSRTVRYLSQTLYR